MNSKLRYFARETIISLRRNLLMTLAGILTVTVSLLLFGGILLFQQWVDHGTEKWKNGVEFEVFLDVGATQDQIDTVGGELEGDLQIRNFEFIDEEEAYAEFQRLFEDKPDLVETTEPGALPTSYRVAPERVEDTDSLKAEYETVPGVDEVVVASDSIDSLLDITRFLRVMFIALSFVLLASALFLIVNTIRLATFARRREIEVMKLVGASNWFVRIPFMAEGLVQGILGAGLAVAGVFGLQWLFDHVKTEEGFFLGFYVDVADAGRIALILLLVGAVIGVIGSSIGLRRFLRT